MKFKTMLPMFAALSLLVTAGCTVDKTKEGNVDLPEFEQTKEGDVDVPAYDVKAADVDVGTTKTEVTVPTVDVNMPADETATPAPPNPD